MLSFRRDRGNSMFERDLTVTDLAWLTRGLRGLIDGRVVQDKRAFQLLADLEHATDGKLRAYYRVLARKPKENES